MTQQTLDDIIADRRAQLEKKQHEVELLRAELRGLELARDAVGGKQHVRVKPGGVEASAEVGGPRTRTRGLSETWRKVLAHMATRPQRTATISELSRYIRDQGMDIKDNTLRSQLSIYARQELMNRVAQGTYQLTEWGMQQLGIPKSDEPPSGQEGGSQTGDGDASPVESRQAESLLG
jgi:hypothetical protein